MELQQELLNLFVRLLLECRSLAEDGNTPLHTLLLTLTDQYKSRLECLVENKPLPSLTQ